jgi:hypothetical protein
MAATPRCWLGARGSLLALGGLATAGGLVLAGCGGGGGQAAGQTASVSQSVSSWVSSTAAGASIETVDVDFQNIDLAIAQHDPPDALKTVCLLLTNDALTGQGNLPSPVQQLTNDLNTAYSTANTAGQNCYKGADGDASLLKKSTAERIKAAAQLKVAYYEITSLVGQPPSTTTTTAPVGSSSDPFGD